MKRKIIGLFICILLIVTSAYSATGNKIVDKNERSPCGLDNAEENHENEVLLHKNIILKIINFTEFIKFISSQMRSKTNDTVKV